MCGIAGLIGGDVRRPPGERIAPMLAALRHRGPDGSGFVAGDTVVLGHTRLAVRGSLDEGRQPVVLRDGALLFNGEIFNSAELWERLGRRGPVPPSDTEVLAEWLDHDGDIGALNGMFAIAWWRPSRGELWLARDPAGVKPLYHASVPGGLIFASEAAALQGIESFRLEPDEDHLWLYLVATPPVDERTLFRGVRAVPPGSIVRVDLASLAVRCERYARSPFSGPRSTGDLEATLGEVVDRQLASDRPLCVALSGGIDSGVLAALARRRRTDLVGYTVTWDERRDVATPYVSGTDEDAARIAAEHLAVRLVPVVASPHLFTEERIAASIARKNAPLSHTTELAIDELYARISRDHVVALTGEGADEVWAGYHFFGAPGRRRLTWATLDVEDLEGILRPEILRRHDVAARLAAESSRYAEMAPGEAIYRGFLPYLLERIDRMSMAWSVEARVPYLDTALYSYSVQPGSNPARENKGELRALARRLLPPAVAERPKSAFPPSLSVEGASRVRRLLESRARRAGSRLASQLAPGALLRLADRDDFRYRVLAFRLLNLDLWLEWLDLGRWRRDRT